MKNRSFLLTALGVACLLAADLGHAPEVKGGEPAPDADQQKPIDRGPDRAGTVKALSGDGKNFTLQPAPAVKNQEPAAIDLRLTERTTITTGKEPGKLAVGQTVSVWFAKGSDNVALRIQIGKLPEAPQKKPAPDAPVKKPAPEPPGKKPAEPKKPREPARPPRDPAPTAAVLDAEVDRHLAANRIPASPQADSRPSWVSLTRRCRTSWSPAPWRGRPTS
jgi:hypothetical protein